MASINIVALSKSFGLVPVIHHIDLSVADGEFVALVGPSGCGKSTLLRIIAGLEEENEGDIEIGGQRVNDLEPRQRNIAMVFQSYALYPHMTVAQNLSFNLKLARVPRDEMAARVAEAARMLDLTDLLDRKPSQLSGGQRQRVAMGRAVVRKPDVFLFDEPLSNLDAKLRVQMRGEIKKLHHTLGVTSIYVTHDQIEAMTLADRIVVMNRGRIEQQGTPMDLYRRPVNLFVAGFIGSPSMNFLDAVAEVDSAGSAAVLPDGSKLPLPNRFDVSPGQEIVIGLRPEHLLPTAGTLSLSGIVALVEPTGAVTHLTLDIAGRSVAAVIDGNLQPERGSRFELSVAPELVHLFDKASGQRISQKP